jgi:tryptophanyl-tRNA synthetase
MGASTNTRIVSGMRPTGPLHLGHYFGVLANWIELERDHDCFFFVADWHALTTEYADPSRIKGFVPELVKDWVAGGSIRRNACCSSSPRCASMWSCICTCP